MVKKCVRWLKTTNHVSQNGFVIVVVIVVKWNKLSGVHSPKINSLPMIFHIAFISFSFHFTGPWRVGSIQTVHTLLKKIYAANLCPFLFFTLFLFHRCSIIPASALYNQSKSQYLTSKPKFEWTYNTWLQELLQNSKYIIPRSFITR